LRRTLAYGAALIMILSPLVETWTGIGLRPGKVRVHPVVLLVAVIS
jgi:hypothetical protein